MKKELLSDAQIKALAAFALAGNYGEKKCEVCAAQIGMCALLSAMRFRTDLIPKDPAFYEAKITDCKRERVVEFVRGILNSE